jgi:hypothetical protein
MADAVDTLCKLALSLADVVEKIACAGTAIEQSSFRTGGKSFLFAQRKGDLAIVRLKLSKSLAAAEKVDGVEVGKGGWTTCRVPLAKAPSATLKRWLRESYALSVKPAAKAKPRKKAVAKKKSASPRKKTTVKKESVTNKKR